MDKKLKLTIYGDSIMKGTVYENGRYHAVARTFTGRLEEEFPVEISNRARFGFTIDRGLKLIEEDIATGSVPDVAIVEYGGNDCNFDWPSVASAPMDEHLPATELSKFKNYLGEAADKLSAAGAKPVFTTLPPIDAERYFAHICSHGVEGSELIKWLGNVQTIYRFQELYSDAAAVFALSNGYRLIDLRAAFLAPRPDFDSLISVDGLHPSELGYELMYETCREELKKAARS